jgi:acetyltransferase EpsM
MIRRIQNLADSIIIFGAGGHSKVCFEVIQQNKFKIICFVDPANIDDELIKSLKIPIYKNITEVSDELLSMESTFFIAIGDNEIRKNVYVENSNLKYPSVISKFSYMSASSKIGNGVIIMPNSTVNTNVTIGNFSIINSSSVIEHDVYLGNFSHVAPNASLGGGVVVGDQALIGIGSCVIPNIKIGNNVTVGAGSTVINDVPNNCIVVGNPARIVGTNEIKAQK